MFVQLYSGAFGPPLNPFYHSAKEITYIISHYLVK